MEPPLLHRVQARRRHPITLVVGVEQLAILADADAGRRPHAARPWFKGPVRGDLEGPTPISCGPTHLAIVDPRNVPLVAAGPTRPAQRSVQGAVEVTGRVSNETEGILVVIVGQPPAGTHGAKQVRISITVLVDEFGEFTTLHHEDTIRLRLDKDAERLV